jgi:hypothetical protein
MVEVEVVVTESPPNYHMSGGVDDVRLRWFSQRQQTHYGHDCRESEHVELLMD